MKKVLLIATLVAATMCANAQFRAGAIVGTNFSSINEKDNDGNAKDDWDSEEKEAHKQKLGLKLGVVGEYAFNDYFAISPELIFTQRGEKLKYKEDGGFDKYKTTINYLMLPINAKGIIPINDDFKIFGFAGIYTGLALSGKYKNSWEYKEDGETEKGDESGSIKFGSKEEEAKRLDFGLNFGAGVEFSNFFVKGEYNLGLSNLSNYSDDGYKMSNRNFGISIGYFFLK
ncbi:MAG: PorT family protein [Bacteroidales bacterium]|jgi:hypothetical protein|nr:PorT family protein [Bacteroidales bacterium]